MADPPDAIVAVVVHMLERGGYDALQLRDVARTAHVSLATVYKHFPTRDELVVAGIERWMADNGSAPLAMPAPGESLYDGLMRIFRHVFEPWERCPRMLEAYYRAAAVPGGDRLHRQAWQIVEPVARAVLAGGDPAYVGDIATVLTHMSYAVVGRFAGGELDAKAILPTLERAVLRLTSDNAAAAARTAARRPAPARHGGLRRSQRSARHRPGTAQDDAR